MRLWATNPLSNPFIFKVYASLLQLQCIKVSQGPSPFPPQASLGSWRGSAICIWQADLGCRYRKVEKHSLRTPSWCLKMVALPTLESLPKWSWVFWVKFLKQGPLDKILTPTAWESCGLLCLPHSWPSIPCCVQSLSIRTNGNKPSRCIYRKSLWFAICSLVVFE